MTVSLVSLLVLTSDDGPGVAWLLAPVYLTLTKERSKLNPEKQPFPASLSTCPWIQLGWKLPVRKVSGLSILAVFLIRG